MNLQFYSHFLRRCFWLGFVVLLPLSPAVSIPLLAQPFIDLDLPSSIYRELPAGDFPTLEIRENSPRHRLHVHFPETGRSVLDEAIYVFVKEQIHEFKAYEYPGARANYPHELWMTYRVPETKEGWITMIFGIGERTSGASPNYYLRTFNFLIEEGRILNTEEVLNVLNECEDRLKALISAEIRDDSWLRDFEDISRNAKKEDLPNLTVEAEGLRFWYSPWTLAPQAFGIISVMTPFPEAEDQLNPGSTGK